MRLWIMTYGWFRHLEFDRWSFRFSIIYLVARTKTFVGTRRNEKMLKQNATMTLTDNRNYGLFVAVLPYPKQCSMLKYKILLFHDILLPKIYAQFVPGERSCIIWAGKWRQSFVLQFLSWNVIFPVVSGCTEINENDKFATDTATGSWSIISILHKL